MMELICQVQNVYLQQNACLINLLMTMIIHALIAISDVLLVQEELLTNVILAEITSLEMELLVYYYVLRRNSKIKQVLYVMIAILVVVLVQTQVNKVANLVFQDITFMKENALLFVQTDFLKILIQINVKIVIHLAQLVLITKFMVVYLVLQGSYYHYQMVFQDTVDLNA